MEIVDNKKRHDIIVTTEEGEEHSYNIPYNARLKVKTGEQIQAGDMLTEGSLNPHDILRVRGLEGVYQYITKEVQRVYRLQGVDIDDKHIEIIIKQMLSKVRVEDTGDTDFLPGSMVNVGDYDRENQRMEEEGLRTAQGERVLLGITKASLATDSFLSAASFQETTRVLTEASIKGKVDHLIGLKENVIIGKLIPAGTGMKRYKALEIAYEGQEYDQDEIHVETEEVMLEDVHNAVELVE